ncbi:serine hydrolase domain-containing protein [Pontibacter korlensis]|uniref:Beta-lactamase-related domain-containing protein n=1 Tax=Pontibacter korlensis TaxID=400092 RepID=A0A0E3ZGS8_9BACT|nr:serine hydrolase domain-containing protein [Pontibacter korlensis]AKD05095.1 hypothetical protein PKOR_20970 [Pontibacter korlensis]
MPTLQLVLDNLLSRHFSENSPGAVVLVAKGDEVLYLQGAGLANLKTRAPITPETTFRLASVSKQFTAMCVHLLEQQGQLKLTNKLSVYFPELIHFGEIQLLHLLNHTSGLPDFEEYIPEDQTDQLTDEDVLRITAAQEKALFSPGSQYRYSNTAYVLLGLLVEQVSGVSYADFLQANAFNPLHIQHTMLYQAQAQIPNRAMGYRGDAAGAFSLSDQNIGTATRGDGCIYTSAQDYLKWHLALQNNFLFNIKSSLGINYSTVDAGKHWYYSMGWFFAKDNDGNSELFHSGDTSGFTNLVMHLPQQETLVACFSNIANNQPFLNDLLQELKQFPESHPRSELVYHLPELTR